MKIASLSCAVLAGASVAAASSKIAVYELPGNQAQNVPLVSIKNSILYLADKFGAGDYYLIGQKDAAVDFIDLVHGKGSEKPNLMVVLKGVDAPDHLHKDMSPSFQIDARKKDRHVQNLVKMLAKTLPKQVAEVHEARGVSELSEEIHYVAAKECMGNDLRQQFKYFNARLPEAWAAFVNRNAPEIEQGVQHVMGAGSSALKLVNDKLYISEMMHMVKLASAENRTAEFVVANLDSLHSIGQRIGYTSRTYHVAKGALLESILALQSKFDITIVAVGTDHKIASDGSKLAKRQSELDGVFATFSKRGAVAAKSCFADEDVCIELTNKCSGHGVCTEVQPKCWQCLCSPTQDKKLSKTTKWAGHDCSKKDIAAQAHLLLWTSVALLATLVGGIKLLHSVGSDALPGVLQAATIDTSR